jgi:hypothetical protein
MPGFTCGVSWIVGVAGSVAVGIGVDVGIGVAVAGMDGTAVSVATGGIEVRVAPALAGATGVAAALQDARMNATTRQLPISLQNRVILLIIHLLL